MIMLRKIVDRCALSMDRAALLDDHLFAPTSTDRSVPRARPVDDGTIGVALTPDCAARSTDGAALSVVSAAMSIGNNHAVVCNCACITAVLD